MRILALCALAAAAVSVAGCDQFPKDPGGTLDRVRAERSFRVGLIAPHGGAEGKAAQAFLGRVAAATGAQPVIEAGSAEPLLKRLEEGELDLVIGAMHEKSPWATSVSLLPPLAQTVTPHGKIRLLPIARNGENAWITLLQTHAKAAGVPE